MVKRLFDIVFSGLGLLILSPFLITFAIIIKTTSPGPIFYRGVRGGKNFKEFKIYKFRSLVVNADKIGGPSTREGDPRMTRIGRFLRKYKLDELPQLINVFKGEMSLVGPRPEVMEYVKLYQGEEKIVYTIKPGMTDYASLWDINEAETLKDAKTFEEAEKIYLEKIRPEKVRLQIKYAKEMSFWTDIKILFRTFLKLIK